MKLSTRLLPVCFLLALSAVAGADQVSLSAPRDATLYQNDGGALANSLGAHFFVGRTVQGEVRRALIGFDFSAIPAGSTINSVTLSLSMDRTRGSSTSVFMHHVLTNWSEGISNGGTAADGAGVAADVNDPSWIHNSYNSRLWNTPGGDFLPTPSATSSVNQVGVYSWSGAGLVADVQGWLLDPSTNYGWLMKTNEVTSGNAKRFVSGDSTNPFQTPVLDVTYTVPAPGAIATLSIAALAAARRRPRR